MGGACDFVTLKTMLVAVKQATLSVPAPIAGYGSKPKSNKTQKNHIQNWEYGRRTGGIIRYPQTNQSIRYFLCLEITSFSYPPAHEVSSTREVDILHFFYLSLERYLFELLVIIALLIFLPMSCFQRAPGWLERRTTLVSFWDVITTSHGVTLSLVFIFQLFQVN